MNTTLSFRKESIQRSSSVSASLSHPGLGATEPSGPRGSDELRQPTGTTITITLD